MTEPDWVHLGLTEDKIPVNSYFVEHPEMILGYMIRDTGRFGENSNLTACVNDDPDFDLQEALSVRFLIFMLRSPILNAR